MPDDKPPVLALRPGLPSENHPPTGDRPHDRLPSRYSTALHEAIVRFVAAGNYPDTAAKAAGLPETEYNAWRNAVRDGTAHPSVMQLFEDIERGDAMGEVKIVGEITASQSLEYKLKLLERRKTARWAPSQKLLVQNETEAMIEKLQGPDLVCPHCKELISGDALFERDLKLIGS